MTTALLLACVFIAALLQTLSGFGFALIVMPFAIFILGVRTASPVVALVALMLSALNSLRFRGALDRRELIRLTLVAACGVPLGVWALGRIDERPVKAGLGVVLIAYALYSLFVLWRRLQVRPLADWWAYPLGFLAGCLGGAYNTSGPPVILYGSMRQWPHNTFRSVLQTFFFLTGALTVITHFFAGHFTTPVLTSALLAAPAALAGNLLGSHLDRRFSPQTFRLLSLALLLVLGLSLLLA